MPVRIYEIAKKLGLESKAVLAKAKDLGIAHAKVASSTLDKITAEYLEGQLAALLPPPAPPEAAPAAHPTPPTPDPAVTVAAPAETAEAPPPLPADVTAAPAEVAAPPPVEFAPPPPPAVVAPPSSGAPLPSTAEATPPSATEIPGPVVPSAPVVEPDHVPQPDGRAPDQVLPAVGSRELAAPPAMPAREAAPLPPSSPISETVPAPTPVPSIVPAMPPTPPAPKTPGLGELIGRIELPFRGRPGSRQVGPPAPPPAPPAPVSRRPETVRGRPTPSFSGGRQMPAAPFRPPMAPPTPPKSVGAPGKPPALPEFSMPTTGKIISLKPPIVVRELAEKIGIKAYRLLHDLMELGVFANLNQAIDEKVAQFVAARHGCRFEVERREKGAGQVHAPVKKVEVDTEDRVEELRPRPPVITIMGHVDHGKTTLLDVIRKSDVAAKEAGGITQHIGAYTIQVPHPERPAELQQLTFLDTPGHAAFSAMRARGANVTDLVILVVAASEGVMPQTIEALNHAKASRVPILVAVNKCDLPAANPLRTRQQLQEYGLVPEEWGGETIYVDVSASTKKGIDQLLAMLVLQAEVMELKANPTRRAQGNVIESGLEPGGPTATVLVRKGTLKLGDTLLCGSYYGRIRALINEEGDRLKDAGPSVAVRVLGLNGVPEAGLEFNVVENEKAARAMAEERELQVRAAGRERAPRVTYDNFFDVIAQQQSAKILRVIVKGDAQGSVEAIVDVLKKIESDKVSLEVVHSAVGTISKDDVMLGASAKAVLVGFHTRMDNGVPAIAKREGVLIKQYEIIYELIDEVRLAMAGLLDPELKEVTIGSAEVRQIFDLSKGGRVAGCMVQNGRIVKGKARIVRRREVIHDGVIQTLRRYQDEVAEVRSGMECGIRVSSYDDLEVGDLVEAYTVEKVPQEL